MGARWAPVSGGHERSRLAQRRLDRSEKTSEAAQPGAALTGAPKNCKKTLAS